MNNNEPEDANSDPEIVAIQKEAGVDIYDQDPEVSMIDGSHGRRKFYESVEKAASAKRARLNGAPDEGLTIKDSANKAWTQNLHEYNFRPSGYGAPAKKPIEEMTAQEAWQETTHKGSG
jgi:hypothetical protein